MNCFLPLYKQARCFAGFVHLSKVTFIAMVSTCLTACAPSPMKQGAIPKDVEATAQAQGTGGAGDAGGGSNDRPTFSEIRKVLKQLDDQRFEWAIYPLRDFYYQDGEGNDHKVRQISQKLSPEADAVLKKIRKDMIERSAGDEHWKFEFKESEECVGKDGPREASTKMCDRKAPICISLDSIQKQTPKSTLKLALTALLMHEVAHQNCAEEVVAKEIERLYSHPTVQDYKLMNTISQYADELNQDIYILDSFSQIGRLACRKGIDESFDKATPDEMCRIISGLEKKAWFVKSSIDASSYKPEYEKTFFEFRDSVTTLEMFCTGDTMTSSLTLKSEANERLIQQIQSVKTTYTTWIREFSTPAEMRMLDFSQHFFPSKQLSFNCNEK